MPKDPIMTTQLDFLPKGMNGTGNLWQIIYLTN